MRQSSSPYANPVRVHAAEPGWRLVMVAAFVVVIALLALELSL
jgi:hypothetical protein